MRQKSGPVKESAEKIVKDIRRMTRRKFSAAEKIRIVLEGLRGEESIAELCHRARNPSGNAHNPFLYAGDRWRAYPNERNGIPERARDLAF
jgi:transposase